MKWICASLLAVCCVIAHAQPRIELLVTNSAALITTSSDLTNVVHLQGSDDLVNWVTFADIHREAKRYEVPRHPPFRYFRATWHGWGPEHLHDNFPYSNQLDHERLFQTDLSWNYDWLKFVIDLNEPDRVYFQNQMAYDGWLHFNFVSKYLPEFVGIGPTAFEQYALRTNQQRL